MCCRPLPDVQRARARERRIPDALQFLADAAQRPFPVVTNVRAQSDQLDGRHLPSGCGQPAEHVGRHPLMKDGCRRSDTALSRLIYYYHVPSQAALQEALPNPRTYHNVEVFQCDRPGRYVKSADGFLLGSE